MEDEEALTEMENACTQSEATTDPDLRVRIVSSAIADSQVAAFIRRFSRLNDQLMPFGRWVSPTYLGNKDITEIEGLANQLVTLDATGDEPAVERTCSAIARKLASAAFDPTIRAFMNVRATRLPHLADVAHYLETATLHFYRQDYFTVANTLVPAIERILVSITGFRLAHGGEAGTKDYRAFLQSATMNASSAGLKMRFEAHRDELLRFLFDRFFKRSPIASKDGTYDASFLNRAFPFHLNEPGSYYTFADSVTYFEIFDLFTEFVSAQNGLQLPGLIPSNDSEIQEREREYWTIILSDWLLAGATPERRLLRPSPYYVRESDHNYLALHDGPALNRLLLRSLPSLRADMLLDPDVPADRRKKIEWILDLVNGKNGNRRD